jgi:hypothetical protein
MGPFSLGPIFIGTIMNAFLYGTLMMQTLEYFSHCAKYDVSSSRYFKGSFNPGFSDRSFTKIYVRHWLFYTGLTYPEIKLSRSPPCSSEHPQFGFWLCSSISILGHWLW